jgi:HlyD family secretion protein
MTGLNQKLPGSRRLQAVALAVVVAAAGWWLLAPGADDGAAAWRSVPVTRGDLLVSVSATGNVAPTNQVDVGSELSGIVAEVLVDDNDAVRKGQVLARLDTSKLRNAVSRAEAALLAARAGVEQAEATTRENGANLARLREMHARSGGTLPSATDLDAAEAALARSVANEAAARAGVAEATAALQSAQTDLAKAQIRSPIDGVVLARRVEPGQTVAASLQAPVLFTLAEDLAHMKIEVAIDEADVGRVQAGQQATFTVDAWPNRTYSAQLARVSFGSQTTEGVVSYEAVLSVDNSDLSLRPGMTATATIAALERRGVLLVPNAALRFTPPDTSAAPQASIVSRLLPRPPPQARKVAGNNRRHGEQQVYRLVDGVPQPLAVTVGETNGRLTEIAGGDLAEGDEVLVEYTGTTP